MKLIMEGWRRVIKEYDTGVGAFMPGPDGDSIASLTQGKVNALIKSVRERGAYQTMKDMREGGEWWWTLINFLDFTGVTDWPEVEDAWNEYMEWYNLQDSDPEKKPEIGRTLFASFVFQTVAAIPMVDQSVYLARLLGLKLTEGFLKSIAKEIGFLIALGPTAEYFIPTYGPKGIANLHDGLMDFQREIDKLLDNLRHRKDIQRLPLGGQKGSSKEYDTFDKKKKAADPDYYPPQKD